MVWLLLVRLVPVQFAYPVSEQGGAWVGLYQLAYAGVIVFAGSAVRAAPRQHWHLVVLSASLVAGSAWFLLDQDSEPALQAMLVGVGLLQLGMLVLLLRAMVNSPRGTGSVTLLMLAVCGFLLLGGVFGAAAALLENGSPGNFSDPTETLVPLPWQDLL